MPQLFEGKGEEDDRARRGWRAAPPAKRRIRSRCCSPNTRRRPDRHARDPGVRDRHRRVGDCGGARGMLHAQRRRRRRRPSGWRGSSSKEGDNYRVRKELREVVLFARAQHHQGPALLAPRSRLVPQPADLPESNGAAAHHGPGALRAEPGGYLLLGPSESVDGASRSLHAGREGSAPVPEPRRGLAPHVAVPDLLPRAAGACA